MGSITKSIKIDKAAKKSSTVYRAFVRRKGFESKSATFESKREAETWLRDNEATATLRKISLTKGKTFAQFVEEFVAAPAMRGTKYWRPDHLEFWIEQFGGMRVDEVSHGDINGGMVTLQTRKARRSSPNGDTTTDRALSAATVNRYLASLASVMNFALKKGVIDMHPMKAGKVEKLTESKGRKRILTEDEQNALLAAAQESDWPMFYLFLLMCLTTAARKSEVLKLRWNDIQLDRRVAILVNTKNGESRALPLVPEVRELLAAASKVRPLKGDYVFYDPRKPELPKNIDTVWKKCRIAAGLFQDRDDPLDRVVLHTTRHSAVTKLLRGGANTTQAAVISGHKTLAMLKRYSHLVTDDVADMADRLLSVEKK